MKTTFDEFQRTSTKEWLEKIRADLKGAEPGDRAWRYDKSLLISPFAGSSGEQASTSFARSEWEIGMYVPLHQGGEEVANAAVLEGLAGGVNALHLSFNENVNLKAALRDVRLDMIHTTCELSGVASVEDVNVFLAGKRPKSFSLRGADVGNHVAIPHLPSVVDGLATGLQGFIGLCEAHDTVTCIVEIGTAYFIEIARLRALRILCMNVLEALDKHAVNKIEVHFRTDALDDDVHQNMIKAGSLTLSAIVGGADRIYTRLTHDRGQRTDHYDRIARNVHHLVQYETDIPEIRDPVSGSYYIDSLTREIVDQVWEKLVKN